MSDVAADRVVDPRLSHSLALEKTIINAAIEWEKVAPGVQASDFFRYAHQIIWKAITEAVDRGLSPSYPVVRQLLTDRQDLDDVGALYLHELSKDGPRPTATMLDSCAQVLCASRRARRTAEVLTLAAENPAALDVKQLGQTLLALQNDNTAGITLPALESLRVRLAKPVQPQHFRIKGLQPRSGRVVLAAQFKSGKTTMLTNIVRSLADGDPILGVFDVEPFTGNVVVFDTEMPEQQLDEWYRGAGIQHDDRVTVLPMRGKVAAFNILDARVRAAWAAHFRASHTAYLWVDCLRPILDALGLDEHREAGRFLVAFDALLDEAGIGEAGIVHHMGHSGERSRGDSRLRDWPDVEWQLVRKTEDPASPRFFKAFGRDVDVPEGQLAYDGITRRLTLVGGSRTDAQADKTLSYVLDLLSSAPSAMSGRAIKTALADAHTRQLVENALTRGVETRQLLVTDGARGAKLYRVSGFTPASVPSVPSVPSASQNSESECPAAYIRRDTGTLTSSTLSVPRIGEPDAGRF